MLKIITIKEISVYINLNKLSINDIVIKKFIENA